MANKKPRKPDAPAPDLFDGFPLPELRRNDITFEPLRAHIWSETKAQLIQNYLYYFGWHTRHGCYIDGFAGPQNRAEPDGWSANLALAVRPPFIRNFHLCELNRTSFKCLAELRDSQPAIRGRTIDLYHGDFNQVVHDVLRTDHLTDTNATFALLDQRSFQCHWSTVEALAAHKGGDYKIELFYFFGSSWLNRSLSKISKTERITAWWGNEDWDHLVKGKQVDAMFEMKSRLENLGYAYVHAWPITKHREGDGRVLYYMFHASDHPMAPRYMDRAYQKLVATATQRQAIEMWERQQRMFEPDEALNSGREK